MKLCLLVVYILFLIHLARRLRRNPSLVSGVVLRVCRGTGGASLTKYTKKSVENMLGKSQLGTNIL